MPRAAGTYAHRKANRLCVDCAAHLQDEDTGVTCLECRASRRKARARYLATERGRAVENAYQTRRYRSRIEAGKCADPGCAQPPAPGRKRCDAHLAIHAFSQQEHLLRKEAA